MEEFPDLKRKLSEWQEDGLVSADQVARILEKESGRAAPPAKSSALAEILGYLGGVLALIAAIVLASQYWDEFGTGMRLAVIGVTSLLVGAAAALLGRRAQVALVRLSDFLFVLATGGLAFFVGIFAIEVLDVSDSATLTMAAGSAAVVSAVLWWLRKGPIRHVALFVSLVATLMSAGARWEGMDAEYLGLALWAFGLAWGLLVWGDLLPPATAGYGLAAGGVMLGALIFAGGGAEHAALFLGVASAAGLVGSGVLLSSTLMLGIGTFGVFVLVPRIIFAFFGNAAGGAVALLITGLVLLGVAVVINRLGRRVIQAAREEAKQTRRSRIGASQRTVAVVAALGVLVVVGGYIAVIGYTPPPDFPSAADVEIPGTIGFMRWGTRDACVLVVPASGGDEREVACDGAYGGPLLWTPEGDLVVMGYAKGTPEATVFYPETGSVVTTVTGSSAEIRIQNAAEERYRTEDGRSFAGPPGPIPGDEMRADDGVAEIRTWANGVATTVVSVAGPRSYEFWDLQWSPDGDWIAAVDSLSRLVVVSSDGSRGPFLIAHDVSSPVWFIPGDATYTVEIP